MNKKKIILLTSIIAVAIIVSIFYIYNTNLNNKKTIVENTVIDKKISISDRCSGCGKCTMIDSEHFKLNEITRKAEIISQNNLESNNILTAISMCRDRAISLN